MITHKKWCNGTDYILPGCNFWQAKEYMNIRAHAVTRRWAQTSPHADHWNHPSHQTYKKDKPKHSN